MAKKKLVNEEVDNRDVFIPTSRYKELRYFKREIEGIGLRIEPETWIPPEIPPSQEDFFTKVLPGEIGRLDLVALRVYRLSSLWWVIAFANDIIDPFEEVVVDLILRFPPFKKVSTTILS